MVEEPVTVVKVLPSEVTVATRGSVVIATADVALAEPEEAVTAVAAAAELEDPEEVELEAYSRCALDGVRTSLKN